MAEPAQDEPSASRGRWRPTSPRSSLRWWWATTWSDLPLEPHEARLERQLGWTRLAAAVAILLSLWQDTSPAPAWAWAMVATSGVAFAVAAAATAHVLARGSSGRRGLEVLSLLDAVLLAMLLPFGVVQDSAFVILVFVLLAIIGGVRLGRFGVLRNVAIAAPFETARLVVGATSFGPQSVEDTVVAVLAAVGLGVLVGDVATAGRRSRAAETQALALAARERVRVRRLRWELGVVDDVVHASGTGAPRAALEEAGRRLRHHLRAAQVHLLVTGSSGDLVVWWSSDPTVASGQPIDLLPGGPRDRALSLGTVAAATHDDLAALASSDGRRRGSVVAAPLPVAGQLVGVVVCDTEPGDLLHRRDALLLGRLGRALAPFVRAAGDPEPSSGRAGPDPDREHEPAGTDGAPSARPG